MTTPNPETEAARRGWAAAREELARVRAERNALAYRCERLEAAIGAASDGVWDVDLTTGRTHYSAGWSRMLGHAADGIGRDVDAALVLLHPDDRPRVEALIARHVAGGCDAAYRTRFRLRHRDGHWVEVLSRGEVVRDHEGRAVRFIGTHVDLSGTATADAGDAFEAELGGLVRESIGAGGAAEAA